MRRLTVIIPLVLVALALTALPASAGAPTAKDLAKKLVAAKLCTTPKVTNPLQTEARCDDGTSVGLTVHAFKTKAAMQQDLTKDLASTCGYLPGKGYGSKVNYRVGPSWWMAPYADSISVKVGHTLGGTIKSYDCP